MKKFVGFWIAVVPYYRFGKEARKAVLMSLVVLGMGRFNKKGGKKQ